MSSLFTKGYMNKEIKINHKDFISKNKNEEQEDKKNEKEKIVDFFKNLLDESYLNNCISDPENKILIYKNLLLLLLRCHKIDSKIKSINWINEINLIIEEKFIFIYHIIERIAMNYINIDENNNYKRNEEEEITNFNYASEVYFINIFYFKGIYDGEEDNLRRMLKNENSPFGSLVLLINACKSHYYIFELWEKTKYFYGLIEDVEHLPFLHLEELMENKKKNDNNQYKN
jgi:hypothetical protein